MSYDVEAAGTTFRGPVASAGSWGNAPVRQIWVATFSVFPSEATAAEATAKSAARPLSCRSGAQGSWGSGPVSLVSSPVSLRSGLAVLAIAPVAPAVAETAGKDPVAAAVCA
jgi:hypothetical protein